MIIHDVIQGSPEWAALRAGIPTASCFDKILSPGGEDHSKPIASKSAEPYMYGLLAERMIGRPMREFSSAWMIRGSELEPDAVDIYEELKDCETIPVGFVTTDDRRIGASPDRFVGGNGMLEVKCPAPVTHVTYLLKKSVEGAYYVQLQGQLWLTGREWVDIFSYHPDIPPVIIRVERNEKFIAHLSHAVRAFSSHLEEMALSLKRWLKPIRLTESVTS